MDDSAHDLSLARRASPDPRGSFPSSDPLPGVHELHLPADNVKIWYTVTLNEGQEVISIQHVSLDT
jgi:hypothetical protein